MGSGDFGNQNAEYGTGGMSEVDWQNATEKALGGDQPHNIVQPSVIVFIWIRTS